MTEPNRLSHPGVPEHQPAAGGAPPGARAAATPQYLAGLNPEQREAVETLDGPVLVLAGAGTGKTRVLARRIPHILSQGRARPGEILSVPFTNKAAREMKLRLGQMLGQAVEGMPWLRTFYLIGGRLLRPHAAVGAVESQFHRARCRRPDQPAEAVAGGGKHRRQALAGANAGGADRRLEESRPDA